MRSTVVTRGWSWWRILVHTCAHVLAREPVELQENRDRAWLRCRDCCAVVGELQDWRDFSAAKREDVRACVRALGTKT